MEFRLQIIDWTSLSAVATGLACVIAMAVPIITSMRDRQNEKERARTDIDMLLIRIVHIFEKRNHAAIDDYSLLFNICCSLKTEIMKAHHIGIHNYDEFLQLIDNVLVLNGDYDAYISVFEALYKMCCQFDRIKDDVVVFVKSVDEQNVRVEELRKQNELHNKLAQK